MISFQELAQKSPSKTHGKPTARSMAKEKRPDKCGKCHFKSGSPEDVAIRSHWLCCDGLEENKRCSYWVHTSCVGFTNGRPSDFENMNWYSDAHNPIKLLVGILKEKKQLSENRKK